jgi:hypothetical protein
MPPLDMVKPLEILDTSLTRSYVHVMRPTTTRSWDSRAYLSSLTFVAALPSRDTTTPPPYFELQKSTSTTLRIDRLGLSLVKTYSPSLLRATSRQDLSNGSREPQEATRCKLHTRQANWQSPPRHTPDQTCLTSMTTLAPSPTYSPRLTSTTTSLRLALDSQVSANSCCATRGKRIPLDVASSH